MMRRLAAFALLVTASASHAAEAGFANGVGVTTDRVRRGVSQTDGPGAVAEVKYSWASGWFAGLWMGSINYANVRGESVELLPFAGYRFKLGSVSAEVGTLHHEMPGAERAIRYDEAEVTINRKFGGLSVSTGGYWRFRNEVGGHSIYAFLDARYPLGDLRGAKIGVSGHVGTLHDPRDARNSYSDGQIGVSTVEGRTILSLAASTSDLDRRSPTPGAPDAGKRVSLTLTRMFRPKH